MTRLIDLEGQRRIEAALSLDTVDRLIMRARREQSQHVAAMIRKAASAVADATGLSLLVDTLRRRAVYRRTVNELSQLDDAVLADIGLTRFEIRRRALECCKDSVPARQTWLGRKAAVAAFRASGLVALVDVLRRHSAYRQTVNELSRLDDAVLADIGMNRGEIHSRALTCANESVPARETWLTRLGAWYGRVRDEHRTVRELSALDERMLRDIGIEPGSLRGTAEGMTSPGHPMVVEAVTALREAAVVLFAPFGQDRDERIGQALDEVERTTGKRAA